MTNRGSYVHNSMVLKISGHSENVIVLCNFLKILMVSGKMIHRAFRTHKTLYPKPIREIFHFHYLPKLYIGFHVRF